MKNPPREEVLSHLLRFVVGKLPIPDLDGVHEGPVVDVIRSVELDHLFHRLRVDTG